MPKKKVSIIPIEEIEKHPILKEGDKAPDFELMSDSGHKVKLSILKGKNVILYFYPKDDTPGCTIEAKDFNSYKNEFAGLGAVVIGISRDDIKSHNKFKEKHCLDFTLLYDEHADACLKYNVWTEKVLYGKKFWGVERSTFLIDSKGTIRSVWRKVSVSNHAKEVLSTLQNMA